MNASLALLALLALAAGFWFAATGSRERARHLCKAACRRLGVQLLDDTVGLRRLRPGRNEAGRVCLVWDYGFEFSPDGASRSRGRIRLRGGRPELFLLEREGYTEYLTAEQMLAL